MPLLPNWIWGSLFILYSRPLFQNTIHYIKIILKEAIEKTASGIIVCHNHPSGNMKPSQSDIKLTNKLKEACKLVDIPLLDHVIVSFSSYYSFADEGLL